MFKSLVAQGLRYSSILSVSHGQQLSNVTKLWLTPLPEVSKWIAPYQVHYIENGKEKIKDIIKIKDAVSIVLYNTTKKKLIFVRQFRPAVYFDLIMRNTPEVPKGEVDLIRYPFELGITLEICAGLVDKDKSLSEIAKEEVLEECGFDVPVENLEKIFEFRSGVGTSTSAQTMFYCEVCDEHKVSDGGGIDDEVIQVVELTIDDAKKFVKQGETINSGPVTVIGTLWFLANKT